MKLLGEKLKRLRIEKGQSQSYTARALRVSITTYREWEKGRKVPVETLIELAKLYGISLSSLLGQKQLANEEIAMAIKNFEAGMIHIRSALAKL